MTTARRLQEVLQDDLTISQSTMKVAYRSVSETWTSVKVTSRRGSSCRFESSFPTRALLSCHIDVDDGVDEDVKNTKSRVRRNDIACSRQQQQHKERLFPMINRDLKGLGHHPTRHSSKHGKRSWPTNRAQVSQVWTVQISARARRKVHAVIRVVVSPRLRVILRYVLKYSIASVLLCC